MSFLKRLLGFDQSRSKAHPHFSKMVHLGVELYQANPDALMPYINGLARKIQYNKFVEFCTADRDSEPETDVGFFFGLNCCTHHGLSWFEKMRSSSEVIVDLNEDVVISSPWRKERFVQTMAYIGNNEGNPWEKDERNHSVTTLLPFRISWFNNGYHSGMTGILKREGKTKADQVFDASKIYNLVHTDGYHFYITETGNRISYVWNVEFAAIFELGRLLVNEDK
ncbi:DUF6710 family protein [Thiomicrorhabdus cannonii]|uniref:DUF6710 family protein n=1 Tax=Thiomicrorhabdus cannonii TaxID=2748011 RepID=UPI0015B88BD1|nr:DUF6710 family protein [Thiomicrorhabdus cannonii]